MNALDHAGERGPHALTDGDRMQPDQLKRREFISLLGGAAAWPVAARAQQPERMRRIGVLMNIAADDPEAAARVGAFSQGLAELVASGETGKEDGRENELKPFVAVQGVRLPPGKGAARQPEASLARVRQRHA